MPAWIISSSDAIQQSPASSSAQSHEESHLLFAPTCHLAVSDQFFFVVVDIFDFPPCPPAMLMHHLELFDPVPVVLVVKGFRP